jgi:hypothetical protein
MADSLLKKRAEQTEGIFRLTGRMKTVDEMAAELDMGGDPIPAAGLHELASLFKRWFRDLPEPVLPRERMSGLSKACQDETFVDFASKLPKAHSNVLMFLIGFLQRMVRAEAVTLMRAKNLAICFAPSVIHFEHLAAIDQTQQLTDMGIEFITKLIELWDTSAIYPLKAEFLVQRA